MSIIGESGVCKFSHRSSSHSNKRLSVWRYIIFCRQPPVFSLNLSLSHSERCHSCDLSSCRRKCKYIQTVSHHHFTLQKLARITSDSQSHKSSFLYFFTQSCHLPVSICFTVSIKDGVSDSLLCKSLQTYRLC